MMSTNFKRILKAGFTGFWRNGFISLSSILVMVIALMVIGSVIFTGAVLKTSLAELQNKADINVYFVTTADPVDIQAIKASLEKLPEVASVKYTSREQALENFKNKPGRTQGDIDALEILGENPFGASLNIIAKAPSQYAGISTFFRSKNFLSKEGDKLIERNDYERNSVAIAKLSKVLDTSNKVGTGVAFVMVILALAITFNTVRIAIYSAREEIAVMKLVGASNRYARGPFVIAGLMYGFVAGVAALILFVPITYSLGGVTANFFSSVNLFSYYGGNFWQIFAVLLGSGLLIGAVSSYLAVRRYLKV